MSPSDQGTFSLPLPESDWRVRLMLCGERQADALENIADALERISPCPTDPQPETTSSGADTPDAITTHPITMRKDALSAGASSTANSVAQGGRGEPSPRAPTTSAHAADTAEPILITMQRLREARVDRYGPCDAADALLALSPSVEEVVGRLANSDDLRTAWSNMLDGIGKAIAADPLGSELDACDYAKWCTGMIAKLAATVRRAEAAEAELARVKAERDRELTSVETIRAYFRNIGGPSSPEIVRWCRAVDSRRQS